MDFKNRLKGTVTQTLVRGLLESAGYHVVPLGIEEVIREVKTLAKQRYLELGLPLAARRLPDFFVASRGLESYWLLEVKYCKQWNEETKRRLGENIREQVEVWNPLHLALFLGSPCLPDSYEPNLDESLRPLPPSPMYSMRVIKLVHHDKQIWYQWQHQIGDILEDAPPSFETRELPWHEVEWRNLAKFQDVFEKVSSREQYENLTLTNAIAVLRGLKELDFFG